jgi:hypothetical protein
MKRIAGCFLVLFVSGCSYTAPRMVPSHSYLLDVQQGVFCRYTDCYDLSLIIPSPYEQRITTEFGLTDKKESWTKEYLQKILLETDLYPISKISDHEFQLPSNQYTNTVYSVLKDEFDILYAGKSGKVSNVLGKIKGVKLNQDIERPH